MTDLDLWGRLAGPKSPAQWADGRSAKETARYWLAASTRFPPVIEQPIAAHSDFGNIVSWTGEPEVRLPFDTRRGEPRNTDLLIEAKDANGSFLLAVEAKADEPFGETVAEVAAAAIERRLPNPRSRAYERILDLALALLPARTTRTVPVKRIRYQLLTAAAGALAEGVRRNVDRTVLVLQEFRTAETSDAKQAKNAADFNAFVQRLTDRADSATQPGQLLGPFIVPGKPLMTDPPRLYLLKVVIDGERGV